MRPTHAHGKKPHPNKKTKKQKKKKPESDHLFTANSLYRDYTKSLFMVLIPSFPPLHPIHIPHQVTMTQAPSPVKVVRHSPQEYESEDWRRFSSSFVPLPDMRRAREGDGSETCKSPSRRRFLLLCSNRHTCILALYNTLQVVTTTLLAGQAE